ncbi:hypothetical protein J2793_001678 [Paraburkholderia caledonica]|uniref:Uncharacterized protein n=1 Tax=Paraburkholderia caledonica TaxID=134536 RepID=A0AB73I8A6_9BURK|nr:hypothetical protein [Paraburkholderia caledonica]
MLFDDVSKRGVQMAYQPLLASLAALPAGAGS